MALLVLLCGKSSHKLSTVSRENLWQGNILRTKTAKDYMKKRCTVFTKVRHLASKKSDLTQSRMFPVLCCYYLRGDDQRIDHGTLSCHYYA